MATDGESPVRLAAETWESLFRAQVAVMRKLQAGPAFKKVAINEYDVLFTLSRCPSGWLRLNELNDHVLLSQSSLSRLVERLEKRGLVERMAAPEDGRGVLLKLTDAEIIQRYKDGASGVTLAEQAGCSPDAIYRVLRLHGVRTRSATASRAAARTRDRLDKATGKDRKGPG